MRMLDQLGGVQSARGDNTSFNRLILSTWGESVTVPSFRPIHRDAAVQAVRNDIVRRKRNKYLVVVWIDRNRVRGAPRGRRSLWHRRLPSEQLAPSSDCVHRSLQAPGRLDYCSSRPSHNSNRTNDSTRCLSWTGPRGRVEVAIRWATPLVELLVPLAKPDGGLSYLEPPYRCRNNTSAIWGVKNNSDQEETC